MSYLHLKLHVCNKLIKLYIEEDKSDIKKKVPIFLAISYESLDNLDILCESVLSNTEQRKKAYNHVWINDIRIMRNEEVSKESKAQAYKYSKIMITYLLKTLIHSYNYNKFIGEDKKALGFLNRAEKTINRI